MITIKRTGRRLSLQLLVSQALYCTTLDLGIKTWTILYEKKSNEVIEIVLVKKITL